MKKGLISTVAMWASGLLMFLNLVPWWCTAVFGGIIGYFSGQTGKAAFATGFAAGTSFWTIVAVWLNAANGGMLSERVGQLFMGLQGWQLIGITGFIGGLLCGMGMLTGALAKNMLSKA